MLDCKQTQRRKLRLRELKWAGCMALVAVAPAAAYVEALRGVQPDRVSIGYKVERVHQRAQTQRKANPTCRNATAAMRQQATKAAAN